MAAKTEFGATNLSIKALTDQYPKYNFPADDKVESFYQNDQVVDSTDPEYNFPTVDFSLLTSGDPEQRSKGLHDLRKACDEWGYFMLINHGVEESVKKRIINATDGFFKLTE